MDDLKLTCKSCGTEALCKPKPEPQNAREGKQARFHCKKCGAINLRDGTVMPRKAKQEPEEPVEIKQVPVGGIVAFILTVAGIGGFLLFFLRRFHGKSQGTQGGSPGAGDSFPYNLPKNFR